MLPRSPIALAVFNPITAAAAAHPADAYPAHSRRRFRVRARRAGRTDAAPAVHMALSPFSTPSLQLAAAHIPPTHTPLSQSPALPQSAPTAQGAQMLPPQSTYSLLAVFNPITATGLKAERTGSSIQLVRRGTAKDVQTTLQSHTSDVF